MSVLHIPIVLAHDVSRQIPREKSFHRVENVLKQLVHTLSVRSWRYEALGEIWRALMNDDFRYMKFIYLQCGEETKLRDPRS